MTDRRTISRQDLTGRGAAAFAVVLSVAVASVTSVRAQTADGGTSRLYVDAAEPRPILGSQGAASLVSRRSDAGAIPPAEKMAAPASAVRSLSPLPRSPFPAAEPALEAAPSEPADASEPAVLSADERYDQAFALLQRASYDKAETAFRAFLELHPDDPRAGNARYWIAESLFARADFMAAAEAFEAAYQANPSGAKAAESVLRLGVAQARLNKKGQACETFRDLARISRDSESAVRRRADQERRRIGCR